MKNIAKIIQDERYIILHNETYNDDKTKNEEVLIYCLLQKFYNPSRLQGAISINMIKELMFIKNRNKKMLDSIKLGLELLIENKMLYDLYDLNGNQVKIHDLKNSTSFTYTLDLPEKKYYKVYDFMIEDLFRYLCEESSNINKFSIFRYLTSICRILHNGSNFGYLSQSSVKFCGESRAIRRYNEIFQDKINIIQYNNEYYTNQKHYSTTYFGWHGDNKNFSDLLNKSVKDRKLIKLSEV